MKKALLGAGLTIYLIAALLFIFGSRASADPVGSEPCVGSINADGTATFSGHCILLAYAYSPDATVVGDFDASLPQTLSDSDLDWTDGLSITLPPCMYQLDLVNYNAVVVDTLDDYYYGPNGWLVDDLHGGSVCEEITTTTTIPETTTTTVLTTTTTGVELIPPLVITRPPPSVELARTGDEWDPALYWAIGLVMIGTGFVLAGRLRETSA